MTEHKFMPGNSVAVNTGLGGYKHGIVQKIFENRVYVKHFNGEVVGYKQELVQSAILAEESKQQYGNGTALLEEINTIRQILEKKAHTVPQTDKEKDLAAMAHPKDKITHKDVLVGRGILAKEEEEVELDEAVKEGDFVKDPRGKIHRVFGVNGTTLHTAEYRGNKSYGSNTTLHLSKATKVSRPVDMKEEVDLDEAVHSPFRKAAIALRNMSYDKSNNEDDRADYAMHADLLASQDPKHHEQSAKHMSRGDTYMRDKISDTVHRNSSKQNSAKYHKLAGVTRLKEEAEVNEAMISYSDFKSKIEAHRKAGNKVVDDKYTDKKASYTTIDKDGMGKKVTHTPQGHKQEHLGSMKGEDDQAQTQATEKRGRGRPTGSKSGARR